MTAHQTDPSLTGNALAAPSTLPFGLPPFADIEAADFPPAFEVGMAEHLAEVQAIAANPAPATFDNTLVALEEAGALLARTSYLFFNLVSALATPAIRDIETEFAPRLAAHSDQIRLDPRLFARIDAVHAALDELGLTAEQEALVRRYQLDFVLAGARLDSAGHAELRQLNQRLSKLSTKFQQNLQASTEAAAVVVTERGELAGLSDEEIAAAAAEATERGHDGSYLIPLILPSGQPLMSTVRNRDVRRKLYEASVTRASAGEHDNGPLAIEMAKLRAKRANLLGFATHADAMVADQTAQTSVAVDAMLAQLIEPAAAGAFAEAEILTELAAADGIELAAWDWAFYSEQVRAQRYSVDTAALRPYFALERVLRDGVFFAAGQVYGITFEHRPELAGYHPDVRVWEVRNADGSPIGLYLGDFFACEYKRGGAWMNSFVEQSSLLGHRPVVVNNPQRDQAGRGQSRTADAGRGQHAVPRIRTCTARPVLGCDVPPVVRYQRAARFRGIPQPGQRDVGPVARGIGELRGARRNRGAALRRRGRRDRGGPTVGSGFRQCRVPGRDPAGLGLASDSGRSRNFANAVHFENDALEKSRLAMDLIPPRYRTSYFQHIFAGGYSAGYYSYIWSEVLDADIVDWFRENGGMTRANGDEFRSKLLSVGGSVDAMDAFRAVRGRDKDLAPLLKRRGLDRRS